MDDSQVFDLNHMELPLTEMQKTRRRKRLVLEEIMRAE